MSRLILALDVETSGLNPATDRIVELGYCLFDVDEKAVVLSGGSYVEGAVIAPEIERITGIRPWWVKRHGVPLAGILREIERIAACGPAIAFAAHNGTGFDRPFIETAAAAERLTKKAFSDLPWIDTLTDLPLDGEVPSMKLRYLALDRGLVPAFPHRALFDAVLCAQLLGTFDFDAVTARATSPNRIARAIVSYDDREKAKALGFRWQQVDGVDRVFTKTWVKRFKECDLAKLTDAVKAAGFRMEIEP